MACEENRVSAFGSHVSEGLPDNKAFRALIYDVHKHSDDPEREYFKLSIPFKLVGTIVNYVKIKRRMMSASNPFWLELWSGHVHDSPREYILKEDDLRSDLVAMSLLALMNNLWVDHGLKIQDSFVQAYTFGVICFGAEAGLVEVVPHAETLAEMKRCVQGNPELRVVERIGGCAEHTRRLAASTAAYLASCYALGVGDGHFDNVMMTHNGALFRIDFGFLFGKRPWLDTPTVCLPKAVTLALKQFNMWELVQEMTCKAFTIVSRVIHQSSLEDTLLGLAQRVRTLDTLAMYMKLFRDVLFFRFVLVLVLATRLFGKDLLEYVSKLSCSEFASALENADSSWGKALKHVGRDLIGYQIRQTLSLWVTPTMSVAKTSPQSNHVCHMIGFLVNMETGETRKHTKLDSERTEALVAYCSTLPASVFKVMKCLYDDLYITSSITLVAAMEALNTLMEIEGHKSLVSMLHVLGQIVEKGDQHISSALSRRLEDPDEDVRHAAKEALSTLIAESNKHIIVAVNRRLQHNDPDVRCAAVEALRGVAKKGDELAIAAVCACVKDADASVRRRAIEVLGQCLRTGNQSALSAVGISLEDEEWDNRHAAVQAFQDAVEHGDVSVIAAIRTHVSDYNFNRPSRRPAVEDLSSLIEKCDDLGTGAAQGRPENADSIGRSTSVKASSSTASGYAWQKHDRVQVWSRSQQAWIPDAVVREVAERDFVFDGFNLSAGSVAVSYSNGSSKWIPANALNYELRKENKSANATQDVSIAPSQPIPLGAHNSKQPLGTASISKGTRMEVWSNSLNTWISDGIITEVAATGVLIDGCPIIPGSVKVSYGGGTKAKWIAPGFHDVHLRKLALEQMWEASKHGSASNRSKDHARQSVTKCLTRLEAQIQFRPDIPD